MKFLSTNYSLGNKASRKTNAYILIKLSFTQNTSKSGVSWLKIYASQVSDCAKIYASQVNISIKYIQVKLCSKSHGGLTSSSRAHWMWNISSKIYWSLTEQHEHFNFSNNIIHDTMNGENIFITSNVPFKDNLSHLSIICKQPIVTL